MIRWFFLFILVAFSIPSNGQNALTELRGSFFQSGQNQAFITLGTSLSSTHSIELAYKGAAIAMSAESKSWPHEKLSAFNEGTNIIENSIKTDPWNAEIRFIRLCIQCKSPSFLGYQDDIEKDCQLIIDHAKLKYINITDRYWQNAITFMLQQNNINDSQKRALQAYAI